MAKIDFINKTIHPEETLTKESNQLLSDYLDWLPIHFKNHNCDLDKLEKIVIEISANFDKTYNPTGMGKSNQKSLQPNVTLKVNIREKNNKT